MARGLARDLTEAANALPASLNTVNAQRSSSRKKPRRETPEDEERRLVLQRIAEEEQEDNQPPQLRDGRNHEKTQIHVPYISADTSRSKSRLGVQLPDVTGLTSAVATPAKPHNTYKPYPKTGQNEEQGTYACRVLGGMFTI
jgi:hypothetical protein